MSFQILIIYSLENEKKKKKQKLKIHIHSFIHSKIMRAGNSKIWRNKKLLIHIRRFTNLFVGLTFGDKLPIYYYQILNRKILVILTAIFRPP